MNEIVEHNNKFSMSDLENLSKTITESKMFGNQTKQQVLVLLMMAQADGIHPMKAMQKYHIIKGRPSMRSDSMLAEYQSRGGKINWISTGKSGDKAEAEFTYNGQKATYSFSIQDAKKAGIYANTWTKYPDAMLRARVISNGVRMICPEAVMGIYTPEEVESFTPSKPINITPEPKATIEILPNKFDEPDNGIDDIKYLLKNGTEEEQKILKSFIKRHGGLVENLKPSDATKILDHILELSERKEFEGDESPVVEIEEGAAELIDDIHTHVFDTRHPEGLNIASNYIRNYSPKPHQSLYNLPFFYLEKLHFELEEKKIIPGVRK